MFFYIFFNSSNTNSITISASTVNANASVSGTGYVSLTGNNTVRNVVVKAQNGDTRTYTINIIRETQEPVDPTSVQSILNKAGIKNNNDYLMGFNIGSDINQIMTKVKNVSSAEVTMKDSKGNIVSGGTIKTGYNITIKANGETKTLSTVLYGDNNGDGKITSADYINVKNIIMHRISLSGAYLKAADADKNGSVGSSDYIKIKNYIMNRGGIEQ